MTGGEIAAATAAAKKALERSHDSKRLLSELASETPEMKAAAKAFARRVEIKQRALTRLFEPLAKWSGASREYFERDFAEDLAKELSDVPEDDLTSPSPSVAVPAIQGLSYSLDDENLKMMYLRLLATATQASRRSGAHPSFAEVIRQLEGEEARVLAGSLKVNVRPIAEIRRQVAPNSWNTLHRVVLDYRTLATGEPAEEPRLAMWAFNWRRLGLFDIDFMNSLTESTAYDWIETRPEMIRARQENPTATVNFDKGVLRRTDFGRSFANAIGALDPA